MDRSFLFQPNVIEASRDFVCVRLSSYENDEESQFLKMFMRTRSGAQENSSFAILAPDGKTKVTGGGRSAGQSYTDAAEMAREMKKLANKYENKKPITQLPLTETVRLGLDIAAADSQPFVLIVAKDQEQQKEWERIWQSLLGAISSSASLSTPAPRIRKNLRRSAKAIRPSRQNSLACLFFNQISSVSPAPSWQSKPTPASLTKHCRRA